MVLLLGLHYFPDEQRKVPVTRRFTVVASGRNPDRFKASVKDSRCPYKATCHLFGRYLANMQRSAPHTQKNRNFST